MDYRWYIPIEVCFLGRFNIEANCCNIMAKNTGIPYEALTKWIIEQISLESGVHTTKIEHDVDLQGRDAVHQIDVLWEFEVGGFKYTTVIQAKDWITQKVDQGKLLQFKCVLADLPNQPRGLVVARKGFQSGAIEFAKKMAF